MAGSMLPWNMEDAGLPLTRLTQKPNGVEGRGREPLGTSDKNCGKECLFSVTWVLSTHTVEFRFTVSETRFLVCQGARTHRRQLLLQRFTVCQAGRSALFFFLFSFSLADYMGSVVFSWHFLNKPLDNKMDAWLLEEPELK